MAHMEMSPGLRPGVPSAGQRPGRAWLGPYIHGLGQQLVGDLTQDTAVRVIGLEQKEAFGQSTSAPRAVMSLGHRLLALSTPKMWP